MQYNLSSQLDVARIQERLNALLKKGAVVELTEKAFKTPNQNRYAHLLMGMVGLEVGEPLEYVKVEYFKKLCNRDIFVRMKEDKFVGQIEEIRSFTALSMEETSLAIDRFKRWGREQGWVMPDPCDEQLLKEIEIMMGRYRQYL